jgi:exopolysaccharide biosynthesis protein
MYKRRIIFLMVGLFAFIILLFYGPYEPFRLLWINTAMYSSHFKFLAKAFYSQKYIKEVLEKNKPAVDRKTNSDNISVMFGKGLYLEEIKGNYFTGFIIKIEDASRLTLVKSDTPDGMLLENIVFNHNALGGINASAYADDKLRGTPWGNTIIDGTFVSCYSQDIKHVMGGFTRDYKMVVGIFTVDEIVNINYLWACEFGPLFIVNGETQEMSEYYGGFAPRTAIGQMKNGTVLLLVVDGRRPDSIGATFKEIQRILYDHGAENAFGLDGGSSTTMVYEGKVVNIPSEGITERLLPNAIIFK